MPDAPTPLPFAPTNDLERFYARLAETGDGPLLHKWTHYFAVYDRHLARYRGTDVHFVEIGVSNGGSLAMWRDYFGPDAVLYGVDVNPECRQFEKPDGPADRIFIGDQGDRDFLRHLHSELPRIDVLLDDGGHTMVQQVRTFEELYAAVAENGVYLCEDIHTSYWRDWGGGLRRRGTFIEMAKGLVDALNGYHSRQVADRDGLAFASATDSLHFYDSVLVIERGLRGRPEEVKAGRPTLTPGSEPHNLPEWTQKVRAVRRRLGIPARERGA